MLDEEAALKQAAKDRRDQELAEREALDHLREKDARTISRRRRRDTDEDLVDIEEEDEDKDEDEEEKEERVMEEQQPPRRRRRLSASQTSSSSRRSISRSISRPRPRQDREDAVHRIIDLIEISSNRQQQRWEREDSQRDQEERINLQLTELRENQAELRRELHKNQAESTAQFSQIKDLILNLAQNNRSSPA